MPRTCLAVDAAPVPMIRQMSAITMFIQAVTVMAAVLHAGAARAQLPEPTALVNQQHCMFCHTTDAPFLAPSFQQIAERYRDKPNASAMLEQKLRHGGKAHWGDMAMPPSAS